MPIINLHIQPELKHPQPGDAKTYSAKYDLPTSDKSASDLYKEIMLLEGKRIKAFSEGDLASAELYSKLIGQVNEAKNKMIESNKVQETYSLFTQMHDVWEKLFPNELPGTRDEVIRLLTNVKNDIWVQASVLDIWVRANPLLRNEFPTLVKSGVPKEVIDIWTLKFSANYSNLDAKPKIEQSKLVEEKVILEDLLNSVRKMNAKVDEIQAKIDDIDATLELETINNFSELLEHEMHQDHMMRNADTEVPPTTVKQGRNKIEGEHNKQQKEKENYMAETRNGWVEEVDGTQKHYVNGKLHRDGDEPAEIRPNGTRAYYKNGKLHREHGRPAFEASNGTTKYALNGKYHRVGGQPAVIMAVGDYRQQFWNEGEVYKAVKKNGSEVWFAPGCTDIKEVMLHREDGPAVIDVNGKEEFWLSGHHYPVRHEWEQAVQLLHDTRKQAKTRTQETTQHKTTSKKEKNMNEGKQSFTDMMKSNMVDAGYRVGATQMNKAVKAGLVAMMKSKGADDGALAGFQKFMETEYGEAFLSILIGAGLNYAPSIGQDARVQRLAEEMRVGGMALLGNAFMGEAVAHLLPAISGVIQNLPALEEANEQVRVKEDSKSLANAIEEEESEETTTSNVKTMAR